MNLPSNGSFDPLSVALPVAAVLLGAAVVLVLVRLVRGPTTAGRLLAMDLLGGCCLAVMAWLAVAERQPIYLDAVLALAIVGFVSTSVLARRLEKGGDE
ncbi:monovalent cation/H+ antiporter complex subunit F [Nibricoccus sp. IMCC34717]|uniref:monovalent cation/H+ antiporter complex subunit F n=1 Tax=Nibricoccus sp. IMCC34717 TaxID=3034021 RepID=UPI00384B1370